MILVIHQKKLNIIGSCSCQSRSHHLKRPIDHGRVQPLVTWVGIRCKHIITDVLSDDYQQKQSKEYPMCSSSLPSNCLGQASSILFDIKRGSSLGVYYTGSPQVMVGHRRISRNVVIGNRQSSSSTLKESFIGG